MRISFFSYSGDISRISPNLSAHAGAFSAGAVVEPAYALNNPVLTCEGTVSYKAPVTVDSDHVIVETIKPCEKEERAFIVRLYECEGSQAVTKLTTGFDAVRAAAANMLETVQEPLHAEEGCYPLTFRPFEIKTLKFWY